MDDHIPEQYGSQRKRRRHRKRRQRPYWDDNESADPDYSYNRVKNVTNLFEVSMMAN
jgi:hypothetical protein